MFLRFNYPKGNNGFFLNIVGREQTAGDFGLLFFPLFNLGMVTNIRIFEYFGFLGFFFANIRIRNRHSNILLFMREIHKS